MSDRLDPATLSDRDHVRLWTAVVAQALKDLNSCNGVAEDARSWLEDERGALRVLTGLGYSPERARAALRRVLDI